MAISVDQLEFQDTDNNWKGIDEIRMIKQNNENNTLFCRTGAGKGIQITHDDDIQTVNVSWTESGVPSTVKEMSLTKQGLKNELLDVVYPVGSIYMSTNFVSPQSFLGGIWQKIEGRFLLAATQENATNTGASQAAGRTGGEAAHKLTASESGIPKHSHSFTKPTVTTPQLKHNNVIYTNPSVSGGSVSDGIKGGTHFHKIPMNRSGVEASGYGLTSAEGFGDRVVITFNTLEEELARGRFTVTDTTVEEYKGYHKHDLPSHSHTVSGGGVTVGDHTSQSCTVSGGSVGENSAADATSAHNNMPPYLAVYMWERTE